MKSEISGFLGVALGLVLPGNGGGSVGNVGVVKEAQLLLESNPELQKLLWGCWNVVLTDKGSSGGFIIAVDAGDFPGLWRCESSSNVTHCWTLGDG